MQKTDNLIGESEPFLAALDHASRLAPLERPLLILGERGTGKELIAQRIHYLSKRWDQPLVSLNCAALSDGIIDSELFGHEAGSFTGAKGRHQGRFERAEGGTLFLDELATSPMGIQEKLLRVIEYGEYERVGGSKTCQANVRLICATNADLPAMAEAGKFRADLLDRLAFDIIHLPPLRERQEDILPLAEYYAVRMCREMGFSYFAGFSQQAQRTLLAYQWPGNVRELKNTVERSVFRQSNEDLPIQDIVLDPFQSPWSANDSDQENDDSENSTQSVNALPVLPLDLRQYQTEQEIALINHALAQAKYNQRKAAQLLGLSYHQLRGLLRKHNMVGSNLEE
ncbi:phage shock protein operon transcriptional activator [Photobacterium sp. WH77]|uniref:phage shock protein operon transcriptional activator n=1 Tax=unclassified Photobacterium TaxID=2628852 RepID=UPI001C470AE6|nr:MULTISPECIES: phage shock protein operon transcriptional activator [unclassified Photobacterium]MBV7260920.1 phage shock protein operon transcriptional activator [Photobacterium sp. WH24]MCG2838581.1 phage shock protein operon transcriptional activator [Photobacterium sp. WH77]MCG2846198.1 phage shock protein operon transcriptional activator [Photobacterium sp. WH80]